MGTFLNNTYGPTVLYLTGVVIISIAMLYIFFVVKVVLCKTFDIVGDPTQDHKALREAKKEAADASLVLGKFPGCNLGEEIYKNISSSVSDYMLIYC